jgi:hypothetical protein
MHREPDTASVNMSPSELAELSRLAELLYRPLLDRLGLSDDQLLTQSVDQLRRSYQRAEEAMRLSHRFEGIRFRATSRGFMAVSQSEAADFTFGIQTILANRMAFIAAQLRQAAARDHRSPQHQRLSRQRISALIIMAMDQNNAKLDDVLDAIKAGAKASGVNAYRIDETPNREKSIVEHLLHAISCVDLVIVDLTHERQNVYYEAGYARALCKATLFVAEVGSAIHYDVSGYPVYRYPNLKQLRQGVRQHVRQLKVAA